MVKIPMILSAAACLRMAQRHEELRLYQVKLREEYPGDHHPDPWRLEELHGELQGCYRSLALQIEETLQIEAELNSAQHGWALPDM